MESTTSSTTKTPNFSLSETRGMMGTTWCSYLIQGYPSSRTSRQTSERSESTSPSLKEAVKINYTASQHLPPLKEFSHLTLNRLGLNKGSLRSAAQLRSKVKKEEEIIKKKVKQYFGARFDEKQGQARGWM